MIWSYRDGDKPAGWGSGGDKTSGDEKNLLVTKRGWRQVQSKKSSIK